MRIAAVISSYNRGARIKATVKSLLNQTLKIEKVIVVDDGSDDGKGVPELKSPKVKVYRFTKNLGVVWGRNYALSKLYNFDFVLIVDDDIILEKNALSNLLNVFEDRNDAIASMPVVYFLKDKHKVWSAGSGVNLMTGQTIFYTNKPKKRFAEIPAATSVLLAKMSAIKKSGWYNPLFYFCYEDADFYYRLKKINNGKIYCVKDAKAYHDIPLQESLDRVAARAFHIARGRVIFLKKYGDNFLVNLLFVLLFSLYYGALGIKYARYNTFFRYLEGMFTGLTIKYQNNFKYKKNLDIKEMINPKGVHKYSVR